jgi:hypothetical protein
MNMRVWVAALALATITTTAFAQAQAPAPAAPAPPPGDPIRLRGTIDSLDGDKLTITTKAGDKVTLTVPADARISGTTPKTMDEVKVGAFLATTTVPKDGKLVAIDVRVFAPGNIQGRQFAYDLGENSLMTNATVTEVTEVPEGRLVKVTWPDGQGEYIVPADLVIYTTEPADKSLLVAGAYVVINGRKLPDGTMTANSISAERNGLKPGN